MTIADGITDNYHKASSLVDIGMARARAGNMDGARESFAAAREAAESLPRRSRLRAVALENVVDAQAQIKDVNGTQQTLEALQSCVPLPKTQIQKYAF